MSQSAIEHFDDDLEYFEQIKKFILSRAQPALQLHLFPSRSCLKLYGRHGVRQYTPRTVSKITKLFRGFSYSILFELGGSECNDLHYRFITKGARDRESKAELYDRISFSAIEKDMKNPVGEPSFYALILHSFFKRRLFKARV